MTCHLDPLIRYHVSLQDPEHEPLLTEIFHKSTRLADNERTILFSSTGIEDYQGQRIIVIRRVLDKFKIARLLILLLLISPALGTVVALFTHGAGVELAESTAVGVAVSAAIFALASFLQALATWLETWLRILYCRELKGCWWSWFTHLFTGNRLDGRRSFSLDCQLSVLKYLKPWGFPWTAIANLHSCSGSRVLFSRSKLKGTNKSWYGPLPRLAIDFSFISTIGPRKYLSH